MNKKLKMISRIYKIIIKTNRYVLLLKFPQPILLFSINIYINFSSNILKSKSIKKALIETSKNKKNLIIKKTIKNRN